METHCNEDEDDTHSQAGSGPCPAPGCTSWQRPELHKKAQDGRVKADMETRQHACPDPSKSGMDDAGLGSLFPMNVNYMSISICMPEYTHILQNCC